MSPKEGRLQSLEKTEAIKHQFLGTDHIDHASLIK